MKTNIFSLIFLLLFLSSCNLNTTSPIQSNECIAPLYKNENQYFVSKPNHVDFEEVKPLGKWSVQEKLPFSQDRYLKIFSRPQYNELWITVQNPNEIYRYSIKTNKWLIYNSIDNINVLPSEIIITNDGQIWGAGEVSNESLIGEEYPFFCKFNDNKNQFEFVENENKEIMTTRFFLHSEIVESSSGILWFSAYDESENLYRLNIDKLYVEKMYTLSSPAITALAGKSNGDVWFTDFISEELNYYSSSKNTFYTFSGDPDSLFWNELHARTKRFNDLYIDDTDSLLLGNRGWLNISNPIQPIWTSPSEIPLYAGQIYDNYGDVTIYYPNSIFQSSNKKYWFSGSFGITQYNRNNNSWCLMTTANSNVVEDREHKLWIAAFGHLYSFKLD